MTKEHIRKFTGNELASLVAHNGILRSLNTKHLGTKNALKLYKLLEKSLALYNDMVKQLDAKLTKQKDELIADNLDHAELLTAFAKIRHDLVASNKFINENEALKPLVPVIEENNKIMGALQNEMSESVHELPYSIDNVKLESALEAKELTVEQIHNLEFLLS